MENSNRKASISETVVKNITQERDSAISQLGVAYFTVEQLKAENEGLKGENNDLKIRLGQLSKDQENETHKWIAKEEALRRKLDNRTEAVTSRMGETVRQPELHDRSVLKACPTEGTKRNVENSTRKDANGIFDLQPRRKDLSKPSKGEKRTVQIEDSASEAPKAKEKSNGRSPRNAKDARDDENSQNLTYLSFLEVKGPLAFCL